MSIERSQSQTSGEVGILQEDEETVAVDAERQFAATLIQQWFRSRHPPIVITASRVDDGAGGVMDDDLQIHKVHNPPGSDLGSGHFDSADACGESCSSYAWLSRNASVNRPVVTTVSYANGDDYYGEEVGEGGKRAPLQRRASGLKELPEGLMADVAASIIQSAMRCRHEKVRATKELSKLREQRQGKARPTPQERVVLVPPPPPPSHVTDVAVDCAPLAQASHASTTTTEKCFYTSPFGFQSNIAASMIQTLWRKKADTQQARIEFERMKQTRKEIQQEAVGPSTVPSFKDAVAEEQRVIEEKAASLVQERAYAAAMIQRAVRVRRDAKKLQREAIRSKVRAPQQQLHDEAGEDDHVEKSYAATVIQRGFRHHNRDAQLREEEALLRVLKRKEESLNTLPEHVSESFGESTSNAPPVLTAAEQVVVGAVAASSSPGSSAAAAAGKRPPLPLSHASAGTPSATPPVVVVPRISTPASSSKPSSSQGQRPPSVLFMFRPKNRSARDDKKDALARVFLYAHEQETAATHWQWERPTVKATSTQPLAASPLGAADTSSGTGHHSGFNSPRSEAKSSPRVGGGPAQDGEFSGNSSWVVINQNSPSSSPVSSMRSPIAGFPPTTSKNSSALPAVAVAAVSSTGTRPPAPYTHCGLRALHDAIWGLIRDIPAYVGPDAKHSSPSSNLDGTEYHHSSLSADVTVGSSVNTTTTSCVNGEEHREEHVMLMLQQLRRGFTVVRWAPIHGVVLLQHGDITTTATTSNAISPPPATSLSGFGEKITKELIQSIPGEANLDTHVERFQRRNTEDAKRLQQQRREFREERKQELVARRHGPSPTNQEDSKGEQRSSSSSTNQAAAAGRGDEGKSDVSLYDAFDHAHDVHDDSQLMMKHGGRKGAESQMPKGKGTTSEDITDALVAKVEAIYGEEWQYKTIVPRLAPADSLDALAGHKAITKVDSAASLEAVVHAGLQSLQALNARIRNRTQYLRNSSVMNGGVHSHEIRSRLHQLHKTVNEVNHANPGMRATVKQREENQFKLRRNILLHSSNDVSSGPSRLQDVSSVLNDSDDAAPALCTERFLESQRYAGMVSVSPSRMQRQDHDSSNIALERSALGGAVSAPPVLTGDEQGGEVERGGRLPHLAPRQQQRPVIPFRKAGKLVPLVVSDFISAVPLKQGLFGGSSASHVVGPSSIVPRMSAAVDSPSFEQEQRDQQILEQFLSQDDDGVVGSGGGATSHRQHQRNERKTLREEYFESICQRHDRLQRIGGVQESLVRKNPGWLVRGARLLPLSVSNQQTSQSSQQHPPRIF